ncbi:MAG: hypothetical protein ABSC56_05365 [Solirubrobacteraceae bacterium]|jgi:hypothetical protein
MNIETSQRDPLAGAWEARRLNESILCTLVAREWRWRGRSAVELALGPRPEWRRESACGAWITEERAGQRLRALEERLREAERTVHDCTPIEAVPTPRLRYALVAHASALARRGSRDHPECLRAEARVLEAEAAVREQLGSGSAQTVVADLRIAALRRRWEAVERSERATAAQRALAFSRLVEAVSPEIRVRRVAPSAEPRLTPR